MKKTYKFKVIFGICLFGLLLGLGGGYLRSLFNPKVLEADYPYYPEVKDITVASDTIVVGKVVEAGKIQEMNLNRDSQTRNEVDSIPYTISEIEVTTVIKGNVGVGDIIEVKQLGDYKDMPEATLNETDGYFKLGNSELLFLVSYDNGTPYSTLNPAQGAVQVLDDQTLYSASKYSLFGYSGKTRAVSKTVDEAIEEISKYIE